MKKRKENGRLYRKEHFFLGGGEVVVELLCVCVCVCVCVCGEFRETSVDGRGECFTTGGWLLSAAEVNTESRSSPCVPGHSKMCPSGLVFHANSSLFRKRPVPAAAPRRKRRNDENTHTHTQRRKLFFKVCFFISPLVLLLFLFFCWPFGHVNFSTDVGVTVVRRSVAISLDGGRDVTRGRPGSGR